MLQIVLGLIAIGLALFLWKAFPAFKWIVAAFVALLVFVVALILYQGHARVDKADREEQERAAQLQQENQAKENRKIASFEQFDALAKNQKNDLVGNEETFLSDAERGIVILTKDLCNVGGQSYKNLQASFLVLSDGKRIDSCWAYNKKTNEIVLITHMEAESFKSEIGFNYFKPVIWDAEKQKFMDKP